MDAKEQAAICKGCKHNTSVQGYVLRCDKPERLDHFQRFYYVEQHPTGPECNVPKKGGKQ